MEIKLIEKPSFSVCGIEGSTNDGDGFIQNLYKRLFTEKKVPIGNEVYGLMSNFDEFLAPWENLNKGLYLAGVIVPSEFDVPEGYTKWDVPAHSYICCLVDEGKYMDYLNHIYYYYLDYNRYDLVGAIFDYNLDGKDYLLFPVEKRPLFIHKDDKTSQIAYCGNHCSYCFFPKCGGCKSDNNFCSFADIFPDKKCPNAVCCIEKNIDGCFLCDDVEKCNKGFFEKEDQCAHASCVFIKKEGLHAFEKVVKNMLMDGINYSKDIADDLNDEERLAIFYKYYY